ncbi:MAG TPA: DNA primase [Patescibacteria group bacterium]|nr:DNA primase [Patescibacteria group bacterium]
MDAVEDIKSRLSIEDVISRYVELKRAGRNFRGLSPFGSEKTPSFMVSPEKQIWHDFSSGKGGNMFSFVMEMEGVDFKGALELLARQAGVDLDQYQRSGSGQRADQKKRLGEALDFAAKFYQAHFKKNQKALYYIFKTRGFSKDTVMAFRIGYSPDTGDSLTKFLVGKGFSLSELKQAGLSTQGYRGTSDMFRGRIMIPLMDPFGSVIGFTARLLNDDAKAPKYINTPQTLLYDKSRHVFGLHLAKEAIRKAGYTVVVEGNMDVIASYQAGVRQVVATAGTAMTDQHLKIIGRLTSDVRLAFDQDKAGLAAAERTIPLAAKADVSLSIITVKDAKDPDELIQKDVKLWQHAIEKPQYALDWLIERHSQQLDISSAQGKRQLSDIVLKVVKQLPDSVEQDHYVTQIAKLLGVSADALRSKLTQTGRSERRAPLRKAATPQQLDKAKVEATKTQNHFLAIMLMQPGLRMYLKGIGQDMMPDAAAQELLAFLVAKPTFSWQENLQNIDPTVHEFAQIVVLLYEELYQSLELLELRYEAAQLQARLISQYVKNKKTRLAAAMRASGEDPALLEQVKQLDELLNTVKEKVNG